MQDSLTIEPPSAGRIYRHRRRVQHGEVSRVGLLRLDAAARMLQDVSDEDTTETGFPADEPWVVRRVDLGVTTLPVVREMVTVSTWCSGIGGRWAERRVRIDGDDGGRLDAAVLWVHLDRDGRPARLPERFEPTYGEAAGGRKVRARLLHDRLPDVGSDAGSDSGPDAGPDVVDRWPFPLRAVDLDVMDHVNNAVSWAPVEEAFARGHRVAAPFRVSLEHPAPIEADAEPQITLAPVASQPRGSDVSGGSDGSGGAGGRGFDLWVVDRGTVCSSAQVRPWRGQDPVVPGP